MTRQNDGSTVAFGGAPQSRITCVTSGRLWATLCSDRHAHGLDRIQAE
jgi:hypothetical protein